MSPSFCRMAYLLQRDSQIKMCVSVRWVDTNRNTVVLQRVKIAAKIVVNITQVKISFEAISVEMQGTLVECLRFDKLIKHVVNVGKIDEGRNKIWVE